eukprot:TRINITY_DN9749_c0_g2_i1.p1 TRINITY_DN9749_c0_g2~~TRINITY_DN9749_c0_g2_i1.p1  ORF type:complete len:268 (-),score=77.55 TRINITY_DN9749_c0_g2_i1:141-944(-)
MQIFPLEETVLFIFESASIAENGQSSVGIMRAMFRYYAKSKYQPLSIGELGVDVNESEIASTKNYYELEYGDKLTLDETRTLDIFNNKRKEEKAENSKDKKKQEQYSVYKSKFLKWKVNDQIEQQRLKKLKKNRQAQKATAQPVTGKTVEKRNIQAQDVKSLGAHTQSLRSELSKMKTELESINAAKRKAEEQYKKERDRREELEVKIKENCMLQELSKVHAEKRLQERNKQNYRKTFQILNFKQIVQSLLTTRSRSSITPLVSCSK